MCKRDDVVGHGHGRPGAGAERSARASHFGRLLLAVLWAHLLSSHARSLQHGCGATLSHGGWYGLEAAAEGASRVAGLRRLQK
eukprot:363580-Chlamydomonas_euryale.AAC.7